MRTLFSLALAALHRPGIAQGAGLSSSGSVGKALKQALKQGLTSRAGNVQKSFSDNLKNNLNKNAGTTQGTKLCDKFQLEKCGGGEQPAGEPKPKKDPDDKELEEEGE